MDGADLQFRQCKCPLTVNSSIKLFAMERGKMVSQQKQGCTESCSPRSFCSSVFMEYIRSVVLTVLHASWESCKITFATSS